MHGQLLATIRVFRDLIHAAEPPYTKPHEYMNIDRPLTPLCYEFQPGKIASRIDALRHALYLLDDAEKRLVLSDKISTDHQEKVQKNELTTIGAVGAILWLQGIDSSFVGAKEAA